MEIFNVLAHPVDNIQNSLNVVLPKSYGLKDLLNGVSHDTLLIRKFPITEPTSRKHPFDAFVRVQIILLNSLGQRGGVYFENKFLRWLISALQKPAR